MSLRVQVERLQEILGHSSIEESSTSIEGEIDINEQSTLASVLETVDAYPEIFGYFNIKIEYKDGRAPLNLLRVSSDGLEPVKHDEDRVIEGTLPEWLVGFRKGASYSLSEEDYAGLADDLAETAIANPGSVTADYQLLKEEVSRNFDRLIEAGNGTVEINLWSSKDQLSSWLERSDASSVINQFFDTESLPIFLFIRGNSIDGIQGKIPLLSIEKVLEEEIDLAGRVRDYEDFYDQINLLPHVSGTNVAPPVAFSTHQLRTLFTETFLFSSFAVVSSDFEEISGGIRCVIDSQVKKLEQEIIFSQISLDEDWLSGLYKFSSKFVERGHREVYRQLWHRAIVEHCEDLQEIPDQRESIIHYYTSLEEKAITGNFEDLSGAIQDAQIFISDVTNTVSDSTVRLTKEVQKVVLALFGAVAANIFLLIRDSSAATAAPFTLAFCTALLLVYLPTAQERVNELKRIIEEGEKDAEVYSDIVENVGAAELFNSEELEERQQAYIRLAEKRVTWTNKKLRQVFSLVSVVWIVAGAYSILQYSFVSVPLAAAVASLPVALRIKNSYSDEKFYMKSWSDLGKYRFGAMDTVILLLVGTLFLKFSLLFFSLFVAQ